MRKKINLLLIIILLLVSINLKVAYAEEVQELPFNIFLELPHNQKKDITSYYNLDVKPKETQHLNVVITNQTSKEITVELSPANAINSPKGGIVYIKERSGKHASLDEEKYYMDQYISVQKEVVISPFGESRVPITVNTPDKNEGTLLGGVLFNLKDAGSNTSNSNDGSFSFTANYTINIGIPIQLNFPEVGDENPLLIGKAVEETLPSGSNVGVEVKNPNESLLTDVSYKYEVFNEDGKSIFKGEVPRFNISPRSNFELQFPWDTETYKTGKYEVRLTPSYSDEVITREFEITSKDLKKYSKITGKEIAVPQMEIPYYTWILLILVLIFVIYGAFRYGKGKVKDRLEEAA